MSKPTKAWMLRQDGEAFEVTHHLYVMQDDDMSSEAEVAAFLIRTDSKDTALSELILDYWMALLIENAVPYDADEEVIDSCISNELKNLPYRFQYPLSISKLLKIHNDNGNYRDVDELYDFIDRIRMQQTEYSELIRRSLDQQFCRVRYGGQYNSTIGNSDIWFRISSVGFNWANTIYVFVADHYRQYGITNITICRDYESDYGDSQGEPEYFYTAKDGSVYYHMPIEEYLEEEHEHSPVFSRIDLNAGVLSSIRISLAQGATPYEVLCSISNSGVEYDDDYWSYIMRSERSKCIDGSEFMNNASSRTQAKLGKARRMIMQRFPEITDIDIDGRERMNRNGNMTGIEYIFKLSSDNPDINGLEVGAAFTKSSIPVDIIVRQFSIEYVNYLRNRNIKV